jgi:hypothetical protein
MTFNAVNFIHFVSTLVLPNVSDLAVYVLRIGGTQIDYQMLCGKKPYLISYKNWRVLRRSEPQAGPCEDSCPSSS